MIEAATRDARVGEAVITFLRLGTTATDVLIRREGRREARSATSQPPTHEFGYNEKEPH
jgi:hypothetical protein